MTTSQPPKPNKQQLANKARQELGELHPNEVELLWQIRHRYRYGTIEIITRDGLPEDILRTVERRRLGNFTELSTP